MLINNIVKYLTVIKMVVSGLFLFFDTTKLSEWKLPLSSKCLDPGKGSEMHKPILGKISSMRQCLQASRT